MLALVAFILQLVYMFCMVAGIVNNRQGTYQSVSRAIRYYIVGLVLTSVTTYIHIVTDASGWVIVLNFVTLLSTGVTTGFAGQALENLEKPVKEISESERIHAEVMAELEADIKKNFPLLDDPQEKSYKYPL